MPDSAILRGRRIVVTRTGEAGLAFAARLRALGAEPILAPTIAILPPDDSSPLDAAIAALDSYAGIVFTSANGVAAFLDRLNAAGKEVAALAGLRCGAVGPATAAALTNVGRAPDVVPDTHTAEALAASFGAVAGWRVLFPAADIARPALADGLRARGVQVDVVTAYRTVAAAPDLIARLADLLRAGAIDAVTFTSPSTVRGFLNALADTDLRDAGQRPAIVCIGPTTAEAARAEGLPVDSIATEQSTNGLLTALIAVFTARPASTDLETPPGTDLNHEETKMDEDTKRRRNAERCSSRFAPRSSCLHPSSFLRDSTRSVTMLDTTTITTQQHTGPRPRRLRRTPALRRMVRETTLRPDDFIHPLFVTAGTDFERPIGSMPGHAQRSVDRLDAELDEVAELGIPSVLLFGLPATKDAIGSAGWDPAGPVPRAVAAIKRRHPGLVVIADVCLCEYTDHGHCGVIDHTTGEVINDETLPLLAREAVAYADAGVDIVAPSAMMDGQVAAIRAALDGAGHSGVPILAYAAKFASAFYGPFREAAESAPAFGDRRAYQMAPENGREALREIALDVAEGADMLMVKPAGPYLDLIRQARDRFDLPLAAYQVSGEYAMLMAAAERGWIDERRAALESLTSIRRAGADMIITYHAKQAARWLAEED